MKKIAIVTTHPIQYNAPLFKLLTARKQLKLKVFYTWGQSEFKIFDPGFGIERSWDIPLLEGYDYIFIENTSSAPGSHHFRGINNPSLITSIKAYDPEAILIYGWSFKSHLKILLYFKGRCKILFRGDSTLLDEVNVTSIKNILRHFFLRWVYKHIDKALYVGSANKLYYETMHVKKHQLCFAPHAIDNSRFADIEDTYDIKALRWRKELGIREDELVFLFAGKLEPKKNPSLLINAFIEVAEKGMHLILVGNGILENELKASLKDNTQIHFIDFQNQSVMPITYRLADVFVLPSQGPGETWGLAVNEAMASKRPVLVSDKCGCAYDLVKENINGYIFKSNDQNDLIKKMKYLIEKKDKLPEFGKQSLRIVQNWSYEEICTQIEKIV